MESLLPHKQLLETTLESFKNKQNLVAIKQTLNALGCVDLDSKIDDLITKIDDNSSNNKDFFDLYLNFLNILESKSKSKWFIELFSDYPFNDLLTLAIKIKHNSADSKNLRFFNTQNNLLIKKLPEIQNLFSCEKVDTLVTNIIRRLSSIKEISEFIDGPAHITQNVKTRGTIESMEQARQFSVMLEAIQEVYGQSLNLTELKIDTKNGLLGTNIASMISADRQNKFGQLDLVIEIVRQAVTKLQSKIEILKNWTTADSLAELEQIHKENIEQHPEIQPKLELELSNAIKWLDIENSPLYPILCNIITETLLQNEPNRVYLLIEALEQNGYRIPTLPEQIHVITTNHQVYEVLDGISGYNKDTRQSKPFVPLLKTANEKTKLITTLETIISSGTNINTELVSDLKKLILETEAAYLGIIQQANSQQSQPEALPGKIIKAFQILALTKYFSVTTNPETEEEKLAIEAKPDLVNYRVDPNDIHPLPTYNEEIYEVLFSIRLKVNEAIKKIQQIPTIYTQEEIATNQVIIGPVVFDKLIESILKLSDTEQIARDCINIVLKIRKEYQEIENYITLTNNHSGFTNLNPNAKNMFIRSRETSIKLLNILAQIVQHHLYEDIPPDNLEII